MAYCLDLSTPQPSSSSRPISGMVAKKEPIIWLLLGDRHGDNGQLRALAATLRETFGWSCEIKQLHFDSAYPIPHRVRGASQLGLNKHKSSVLQAPWPDIVMAAGKSSVSVSRWICRKSGGKTLNVLLGRPRAAHRHFDLIVATPQYGLPNSDNVVQCSLPMTRTDARHSPERMPYWQDKWRDLPRPWTAVMIGGGTAQLKFDDASALNLLEQLERYRLQVGGSLLVTTSPRTPPRIAALISTRLPRHSYFHAWQEQAANPYQAFLALADRFVVTIDSVTMIAEAVDRMKPVYYFKLPQRNVSMRLVSPRLLKRLRLRRHRRREEHMVPDLLDRLIDRLAAGGIISSRNDYSSFEADLRHRGVARPLDALMPSVPWPQHNLLRQESQHVAHRIWALWCSAQGQPDC